jgi:predicted lipid-binding transport protein (Tim44 family)
MHAPSLDLLTPNAAPPKTAPPANAAPANDAGGGMVGGATLLPGMIGYVLLFMGLRGRCKGSADGIGIPGFLNFCSSPSNPA